jgi:hypothetical protein
LAFTVWRFGRVLVAVGFPIAGGGQTATSLSKSLSRLALWIGAIRPPPLYLQS